VLRILPELYALAPPSEFSQRTISLLHDLVGCDYAIWLVLNYTNGVRLAAAAESEKRLTPELVALLEASEPSSPHKRYAERTRDPKAVIWSRLPQRECLEHRSAFGAMYRQLDSKYQLAAPIAVDWDSAVLVGFHRKRRDFTEQDRILMDLLQPHVRRAYSNALTRYDNASWRVSSRR